MPAAADAASSGSQTPGPALPAFELLNQHGELVRHTDLIGSPAFIVFYPHAFTPVCTGELDALATALEAGDLPSNLGGTGDIGRFDDTGDTNSSPGAPDTTVTLPDGASGGAEHSIRIIAVSTDPQPTLAAWHAQQPRPFDLLADFWPHGAFARACSAFDERSGAARRVSLAVDAAGHVHARIEMPSGEPRPLGWYFEQVQVIAPSQAE